jgi:hypothetical protein
MMLNDQKCKWHEITFWAVVVFALRFAFSQVVLWVVDVIIKLCFVWHLVLAALLCVSWVTYLLSLVQRGALHLGCPAWTFEPFVMLWRLFVLLAVLFLCILPKHAVIETLNFSKRQFLQAFAVLQKYQYLSPAIEHNGWDFLVEWSAFPLIIWHQNTERAARTLLGEGRGCTYEQLSERPMNIAWAIRTEFAAYASVAAIIRSRRHQKSAAAQKQIGE